LSVDDAARQASDRARIISDRFANNSLEPRHPDYGYGSGALREEVVRELLHEGDELSAALTRNQLGCLILNSSEALFVDIDLPESKPSGGILSRIFGRKSSDGNSGSPKEEALKRIEQYARQNSMSARVYETRAGLRVLFTNDVFRPKSSEVNMAFEGLGADPLYIKLCGRQNSFRARVSPKPWRCGNSDRPPAWPFNDERERSHFNDWLTNYERLSSEYASCKFLHSIGNKLHSRIGPIQEIHDELSKASSALPLA